MTTEQTFKPFCFMTQESKSRLLDGGNCKGAVPVHGGISKTAKIPLYTSEVLDRIDQLERQLAEAKKDRADAKRYRWLRDDASGYQRAGPLVYWSGEHGESIRITYGQSLDDELDYAMGAAIAQQKVKT